MKYRCSLRKCSSIKRTGPQEALRPSQEDGMRRNTTDRCCRSSRRLVTLDLAAHGTALVIAAFGGVVLESVVLSAAASHHVATIGFRLLIREKQEEQIWFGTGEPMLAVVQLILWTCCVLLTMCVTAAGAHGLLHAEPLDAVAITGFAVPGVAAAATTAVLTCRAGHACYGGDKVDALLSVAPTSAAICVPFVGLGAEGGRLDALAGLALVLLLCTRTLLHLGRTLN